MDSLRSIIIFTCFHRFVLACGGRPGCHGRRRSGGRGRQECPPAPALTCANGFQVGGASHCPKQRAVQQFKGVEPDLIFRMLRTSPEQHRRR